MVAYLFAIIIIFSSSLFDSTSAQPPFDISIPNLAPTFVDTDAPSSPPPSPSPTLTNNNNNTNNSAAGSEGQLADVRLQQVQTTLDSSSSLKDAPEFTFVYKASPILFSFAPQDGNDNANMIAEEGYYRLRIMTPECQFFDTTGELSPGPIRIPVSF
jgi:hypothetical protein